jgi:hypothetical protein
LQSPVHDAGAGGDARSYDPNLILILNLLLFGCAGYWLLGQRTKAIIAAVAWVAGLATCGVVSGIVMAIAAVDGYRIAKARVA